MFGHLAEIPVGTTFSSRQAATAGGIHRPNQGGIWGGKDGAESVVVSGGYVDDQDFGNVIVYTGQGGRDQNSGRQIADQEFGWGNLGLARGCLDGLPVRVIGSGRPGRTETTIQRIIRSTKVAEALKHLYDYTCQVCQTRLATHAGGYAEAAHIQALGVLHNGPDVVQNLLCLCPNDHVRFDAGANYIDDALAVRDSESHAAHLVR
ncbi:YDG/SRA domain-containing protein [Mycolicibacterium sp. Dal123E01]|uniref:YDG/SRA domain-containing protein n=1 Tax=Mycolicibacterium sp. Dal123E01 TaxID=3457578 RepID=UPI00403EADC2